MGGSGQPVVAIPMGDPAGIGPEVVLKALADPVAERLQPLIFGNRSVLDATYRRLCAAGQRAADPAAIALVELPTRPIEPGRPTAAGGDLSFRCLRAAVEAALAGRADAVMTAPIAKTAWHLAGHRYPGQTEVLTEMTGARCAGMLFVARSPRTGWTLRVLLATTHIPLSRVSAVLDEARVEGHLTLLFESLAIDFGLTAPRIAVAGLNPHAGEGGRIGSEEADWLTPLLERWRGRGVDGPVPPDTLWVAPGRAWWETGVSGHDAYLALYHDQGLIPVKMLAFDQAVNTTIGLPIVRTSPDHGTAFDIAGRGIARPDSTIAALALACDLAAARKRASLESPSIPQSV